ncbi:MAG: hypothetical protein K9J06_16020 [Flavobacteriales bacterium]|nr:hypothetical protein [Flavobacteriales bacterium]
MRYLLLNIGLLLAISTFGQIESTKKFEHADLTFSPRFERNAGSRIWNILGVFDGFTVAKGNGSFLKYSTDFQILNEKADDLGGFKQSGDVLAQHGFSPVKGGKNMIRFFSLSNAKSKTVSIYGQHFNPLDLSFSAPIKVSECKNSDFIAAMHDARGGVIYSPDTAHVAYVFKLPESNAGKNRIRVIVVDGVTIEKTWERDVVLDQKDGEIKLQGDYFGPGGVSYISDGSVIDDDGVFYSWMNLDKGRSVTENRIIRVLIGVSKDDVKFERLDESGLFTNERARDAVVVSSGSGCFLLCDYENKKEDKVVSGGLFVANWDMKSGSVNWIRNELSSEKYFSDLSASALEKLEKSDPVPVFKCTDRKELIHELSDGSFIVLGENNTFYRTGGFFHGHQYVVRLDETGKMVWETRVPYSQDFGDGDGGGMRGSLSFVENDRVFILFNDSRMNAKPGWEPSMGVSAYRPVLGEPVTMVTLDVNDAANRTRETVWDSKEAGGFFEPRNKFWAKAPDGTLKLYILGAKTSARFISVRPN